MAQESEAQGSYYESYDLLQGPVVTELVVVGRLFLQSAEKLKGEEGVNGAHIALIQELLWRLYSRYAQLSATQSWHGGIEPGNADIEAHEIQEQFITSAHISLMTHLLQAKMQHLGLEEVPRVEGVESALVLQAARGIGMAYRHTRDFLTAYDEGDTEFCHHLLRESCGLFVTDWGGELLNALPALHALRFVGGLEATREGEVH